MHKIRKATFKDAALLSTLSKASFLPAHGHAASKEIIDHYIALNFSEENFLQELCNSDFQYYLIYYNNKIAGFSKVIFNCKNDNINENHVTKMERLYLLKEFYNLKLGKELMQFNIQLAKNNNQTGIWLYVWEKNTKAIDFYTKTGFLKVASYNFPLSKTESRPNHILYLKF